MKKLLIVEDDAETRQLLSSTFERDFTIFEADNGVDAIRNILEHHPDILIVDGMMPRLDGLSVVAAVKSDPKLAHILVVMLSGRSDISDLERGIDAGADAYFIKPTSPNRLRTWVTNNSKPGKGAAQVLANPEFQVPGTHEYDSK